MRLSRTIAYAVYSILQLGKAPSGVSISRNQLANTARLPERFLLEVLHSLNAAGLVRSTRGVDGGFSLARAPGDITLQEIFEAFDFPQSAYVPALDGQYLQVNDRILEALKNAHSAALIELRKVTVAELLQFCNTQPTKIGLGNLPLFTRSASELASAAGDNASV
jgi:Rrf2 family transcriptional regulator, cysteine metabolism repressor